MLSLFGQKISGVIKKYSNKLRSQFKRLTNTKKIANKLFKSVFSKIKGLFFSKPKSIEDYIKTGTTYIAKKALLIGAMAVLVFLFIFNNYIFPWAEGRLWIPEIVINTDKYFSYSGKAKVVTSDKTPLYLGEMQEGRITGAGSLYDSAGYLVYRGNFLQEQYDGIGERYARDGSLIYKGEFAANLYHGKGQLYDNGHLFYDGEFQKGLFHGKGNQYYENGNLKLSGTFASGKLNGEGKFYNRDGKLIYQGFFLDGLYDGVGVEYNAQTTKTVYEGQFSRGLYEGVGKLYDLKMGRLKYDGEFVQGVYSGQGSLFNWKGQNIYTGYFYNGEIDYLRYIDQPVNLVREEFGSEDGSVIFDYNFLISYEEFPVLFSLDYSDDSLPIVHKMIYLGEQDFLGGKKGMALSALAAIHGEGYSEFYYLVDEEKQFILNKLGISEDIDELYSVRYIINDDVFVRYYALDPQGEILYFEMGGL